MFKPNKICDKLSDQEIRGLLNQFLTNSAKSSGSHYGSTIKYINVNMSDIYLYFISAYGCTSLSAKLIETIRYITEGYIDKRNENLKSFDKNYRFRLNQDEQPKRKQSVDVSDEIRLPPGLEKVKDQELIKLTQKVDSLFNEGNVLSDIMGRGPYNLLNSIDAEFVSFVNSEPLNGPTDLYAIYKGVTNINNIEINTRQWPSGIIYIPNFLTERQSSVMYDTINAPHNWKQEEVAKVIKVRENTQQYGHVYDLSLIKTSDTKKPFTQTFPAINTKLSIISCLSNLLYENKFLPEVPNQIFIIKQLAGQGMVKHSYNNKVFKEQAAILNLGGFCLFNMTKQDNKVSIPLFPGGLLILSGEARYSYVYSIDQTNEDRIETTSNPVIFKRQDRMLIMFRIFNDEI